jgi:hypothetical protein
MLVSMVDRLDMSAPAFCSMPSPVRTWAGDQRNNRVSEKGGSIRSAARLMCCERLLDPITAYGYSIAANERCSHICRT